MATYTPDFPMHIDVTHANNVQKMLHDEHLNNGTYLIQIEKEDHKLEGYIRVHKNYRDFSISGDLYKAEKNQFSTTEGIQSIPSFKVKNYHSYLVIKDAFDQVNGLATFKLLQYLYIRKARDFNKVPIIHEATLSGISPIHGELKQQSSGQHASFKLTKCSDYFRKVSVQFHKFTEHKYPESESNIRKILNGFHIDATVTFGKDLDRFSTINCLNKKQLNRLWKRVKRTINTDTNKDWMYHILIVDKVKNPGKKGEKKCIGGVMFTGKQLSGKGVRAAAAIAAKHKVNKGSNSNTEELQDMPVLFLRTFLHEFGHCMGLDHKSAENKSIMMPANKIGKLSLIRRFHLKHSTGLTGNRRKIVHMPDPFIRPGMIDHGEFESHNDPYATA